MRRWLEFVRYLVGVSLRIDRRRTYVLVGLVLVTALSVPLFALGTKAFVNAAAAGNANRAMVLGALVGVLWIASVAIGHLVRPVAFELGDLNGARLRRGADRARRRLGRASSTSRTRSTRTGSSWRAPRAATSSSGCSSSRASPASCCSCS